MPSPGIPHPSAREQYEASRYFAELDGLRAVSVLMVVMIHMGDALWAPLHGNLGVIIFFVISGYLITTLLLREQRRDGKVSLRGFYLRRAFRIFPLYYLALAGYSLLVLAGFGTNPGDYGERLIYFLTYLNEFAGTGTFSHSWSLGIEEKFYLLWPLLAFVVPATARRRPWLAAGLLVASAAVGVVAPNGYLGLYVPILAGCCLAVSMATERGFRAAAWLARPAMSVLTIAVALVVMALDNIDGHVHVVFAIAVTLTFPTFLIGRQGARRWLTIRPLTFVGQRSYAVYLFHPLVLSVVDLGMPRQGPVWMQATRLVLVTVGSLLVADILFRTFERPLINIGHRISRRQTKPDAAPALAGSQGGDRQRVGHATQ